jgi:hypothetical protein
VSTLRVDNLNARTGTSIVVPTGTRLYAPGHVVQVVQNTLTTAVSTSTTSYANTGLIASITPTYSNSKILVTTSCIAKIVNGSTTQFAGAGIKLLRNISGSDTTIIDSVGDASGPYNVWMNSGSGSATIHLQTHSFNYLDSPATTSSITYRTQGRVYTSGMTLQINPTDTYTGTASIILMEIAQ